MNIVNTASNICLFILTISLGCVLYRVVRGPHVPDRIAALDLTVAIMIAAVGVLCIKTVDPAYLDVAIVLAIVGFLSTTAFSRYLERRVLKHDR